MFCSQMMNREKVLVFRIVYFIELTISHEHAIEEALERNKHTQDQIGVRGFIAKSTTSLRLYFGFQGWSLKGALKELYETAEKVSQWL